MRLWLWMLHKHPSPAPVVLHTHTHTRTNEKDLKKAKLKHNKPFKLLHLHAIVLNNCLLCFSDRTILVDTDLPPLRGLYVLGTLEFPTNASNVLSAACIVVVGGMLKVGK